MSTLAEFVMTDVAAKQLGVVPRTVINSLKDGRLKGEFRGGIWFVRTSSLKRWRQKKLGRPKKILGQQ